MRTTITAALATATLTALLMTAPAEADDLRPPSRPGGPYVAYADEGDQFRLEWFEPARTGSHPIRRYVIRWSDGRLIVPASRSQVEVPDLAPGRYVFRVKAVSRAGASPWARSMAVYVE